MKIILGLVLILGLGCSTKKPASTVPTNKAQELPKDDSAKQPEPKTDAPASPATPASADPCGG
ncbi:MAG: hypothetical protein ABI467_06765 [Kofleriaceae bacterium]